MSKLLKWFLIIVFVALSTVILGYSAKRFYDYLIQDAISKIKKGVSSSLNPFKLPVKLFGR